MENKEVAIRLSGVKKMYKLGQIGGGTLQADLQSWWARVRGKDDPNTVVGTDQRLIGKTFMALNGIDLTIYQGEAVGIIGGNGAGKSTMLKLLSRVTAPTEGEIDIYGRIASMLEVGTGFNPEMTGRENVYLNGAILGMTKAEIDAKMEDIIEFSEVREFIDTPVKRYSSGMYVKLAFSVAAHLDSEIMIMDEVLAVGDMAFQKKCLGKMKDAAQKEGRTVLYVSHNMNTIRQLCDRCIVLDKGKVVFEGDVEKAINVYLHNSSPEMMSDLWLADIPRPKYVTEQVRIDRFRFDGINNMIYRRNQKIPVTLNWTGSCVLDDIRARVLVMESDGNPVGLAFSDSLGSSFPDKMVENKLLFDFSGLVDGTYYLTITLFQKDTLGNSIMLDTLERFSSFVVSGGDGELKWPSRAWGAINFPIIASQNEVKGR